MRHDSSGITTYGLIREMSTTPIPSRSMAHFTLLKSGFRLWKLLALTRCQGLETLLLVSRCYFQSLGHSLELQSLGLDLEVFGFDD